MAEPDGQRKTRTGPTGLELAAVGTELAGIVGVLVFIGYWLDRWMELTFPAFLLAGAALGIVGGLVRLWLKVVPPRK